jgi:hypothetical protein
MDDDDIASRSSLAEGIVFAGLVTSLGLGFPDRMMAAPSVVTPLEGIFLEQALIGLVRMWIGGAACFYCVDYDKSQWCGAAGSWRRVCDDGCTQGGGVVWRRGGVDGRNDEVYANIYLEDCSAV